MRSPDPLPPLSQALKDIDRVFGHNYVFGKSYEASIDGYYAASAPGYHWVHSRDGCMHLALSAGPEFRPEDYDMQAAFVADLIVETGARRAPREHQQEYRRHFGGGPTRPPAATKKIG